MRRKLVITAIISTFILGACGVKGQLKTPPPLWGDKSKQSQPAQTSTQAPTQTTSQTPTQTPDQNGPSPSGQNQDDQSDPDT